MRRRWLINGALTVGLIALALALWRSQKPAPVPAPTVSDLAPARIHRIEVHAQGHVVVLTKAGRAAWRLTRPVDARADPDHVAALLKLAGATASRRYARGAIASHTTGLAEPTLTVRYNKQAPIAVGGDGPVRGQRYLRTAHGLLLAPAPELASLALGWSHWIDPALVPETARLTRLVLPRFTLRRVKHGRWGVAPVSGDPSAADAKATAAAWRRVKALAVVPADSRRARTARITLDFAGVPPRYLDIIETRPNLILRDARIGVDYHLAGNRVAPLLALRHPRALVGR